MGLAELLFPPRYIFCREFLSAGSVCPRCAQSLPARGLVRRRHEFIDSAASPFVYDGPVRAAILRYKFRGRRAYAEGFAPFLARCVEEELGRDFDVVTWAPISARRLRERGFDQSELIARLTAEKLDLPIERLLRKTRDTKPNSSISGAARRRANVSGAYTAVDTARFRGAKVLLIDDILTTGATLSECARVLLTAGAGSVCAATLAAAPERR